MQILLATSTSAKHGVKVLRGRMYMEKLRDAGPLYTHLYIRTSKTLAAVVFWLLEK